MVKQKFLAIALVSFAFGGCAVWFVMSRNHKVTQPVAMSFEEPMSPLAKAAKTDLRKGDNLYNSQPEKAAEAYRHVIAAHKDDKDPKAQDQVATAHIRLAYLASHKNDFKAARQELAQVTTNYKGSNSVGPFGGLKDQAAYESAAALMGEGKKDDARKALIQFLKDYPASPLINGAYTRLKMLGNGSAGDEVDELVQKDLSQQEKKAAFESSVCGPKALSYLLTRLGKPSMDYETIAKLCATDAKGTTVDGMRKGMKALGLQSFAMVLNREDFATIPTPSIWLNGDHYYVVLKVDGEMATVYDPMMDGIHPLALPKIDDPDFQASVITLTMPTLKEAQS